MKKKLIHIILLLVALPIVSGCHKTIKKHAIDFKLKPFPRYYLTFNDNNEKHLAIASTIGILPVSSRSEAEKMHNKLVLIKSNNNYVVDNLKHSLPFLVKIAAQRLDLIGKTFKDSLARKGGPPYKIIVTSVLRTVEDVDGLRKRNLNSNTNSAHLYGTTFDIAYTRFERLDTTEIDIDKAKLKVVLAEVLRDMKNNNKCLVKYEVKQGCFHVTANL